MIVSCMRRATAASDKSSIFLCEILMKIELVHDFFLANLIFASINMPQNFNHEQCATHDRQNQYILQYVQVNGIFS